MNKNKPIEKRDYLCEKCGSIHHYLYHGKPSNIYQKHLNLKVDFIENLSTSFIFNRKFKRTWKNYNLESHAKRYKQ